MAVTTAALASTRSGCGAWTRGDHDAERRLFESERLREFVCQMADDWGLEATLSKEKDIQEIVAYDLISTPTAVIDGWVKMSGSIPRQAAVRERLEAASGWGPAWCTFNGRGWHYPAVAWNEAARPPNTRGSMPGGSL